MTAIRAKPTTPPRHPRPQPPPDWQTDPRVCTDQLSLAVFVYLQEAATHFTLRTLHAVI